jgi:DNA-directed RNA polymerase subunit RPC12/RpoP
MDLAIELQKIYDSEINIEIGWLWDGGIEVRLGDKMSGYVAEENLTSTAEILPWFQEAIAHFFPASTYASSLDTEVRERGAKRIFLPARVGATVTCPYCGAPNASPGFDKLMIFYCARCGSSVEVKEPRVN